jgi:predicted Ser/Thr protein kinase
MSDTSLPMGRTEPAFEPTVPGPVEASGANHSAHREGAATIGRFLILRKLGEGGMGEVFSAYDEQLDRKVAIKLLQSAYAPEETQKRLLREAQALARLSHPNVVAVHEVGEANGDVFVVMEHIDGKTLREWQNEEPRSAAEILAAYRMAGRGLAAVHAAGMVHRDFKPDNVMIDRKGRVRLLDFGLAHARGIKQAEPAEPAKGHVQDTLQSELTIEGAIVGTLAYMSPEQFLGQEVDARSDQFSFCVALYESIYQKNPFTSSKSGALLAPAAAEGPIEPPTRADIPNHVREALLRGLAREPNERFASMDALLAILDEGPVADPTALSRQRVIFALLLAAAAGGASIIGHLYDPALFGVREAWLTPAVIMTFISASATYIFRNTLFRNHFHRVRMLVLVIGSASMLVSRAFGVVAREEIKTIVIRDHFILATAFVYVLLLLAARPWYTWLPFLTAMLGIAVLLLQPAVNLEAVATFSQSGAMLAFLFGWHRSARQAKLASAAKNRTTDASGDGLH